MATPARFIFGFPPEKNANAGVAPFSFCGPADAHAMPKSNAMLGRRGAGRGVALLAIKASNTAGVAPNALISAPRYAGIAGLMMNR
jgi:hypothetical protein